MDEYQVTAITLQHTATGARYIHLDCEDTDNVFAVAFPTIPDDSTGAFANGGACASAIQPPQFRCRRAVDG